MVKTKRKKQQKTKHNTINYPAEGKRKRKGSYSVRAVVYGGRTTGENPHRRRIYFILFCLFRYRGLKHTFAQHDKDDNNKSNKIKFII